MQGQHPPAPGLGLCEQPRCGILDLLAGIPNGTPEYIRASGAVNTLLMPHEMGELFKVIAIGRGIDEPLTGFASGDQSRRL